MHLGKPVGEQHWFRERFADLQSRLLALEANAGRFIQRQQAGELLGAEVSMLKMRGSRLIQLWEELIVDGLGADAFALSPAWLAGKSDAPQMGRIAGTASSRRFLCTGLHHRRWLQ
jgi:acyl-CoA dehydrogenase